MLYQVKYGSFPTAIDGNGCPSAPNVDATNCLKSSSNNSFSGYTSNGLIFSIISTNTNSTQYYITNDLPPTVLFDPADWIVVGTQTWAKENLNVGTMTLSSNNQTNDSNIEKYCQANLESNCTTYGALYQWNEAMQYVTTAGAKGICPIGAHIPTDNDWKILEVQLGMAQVQADATGWRGY